jgi:hypothetical protein
MNTTYDDAIAAIVPSKVLLVGLYILNLPYSEPITDAFVSIKLPSNHQHLTQLVLMV